MKTLFLILALAFTAHAQIDLKGVKNPKDFVIEHDKFTDRSSVTTTFGVDVKESQYVRGRFMFYAKVSYSGTDDPVVTIGISAHANDWHFLHTSNLYVLHDGQQLVFNAQRGSRIPVERPYSRYSYQLNEWIVSLITRDDLSKIANSKSVELKANNVEFRLKEKHLQNLRDLITLARRS